MKRFTVPKMSVVELTGEDVLCSSYCGDQFCEGYDCPDCPTECTGIYHCEIFKCTRYRG